MKLAAWVKERGEGCDYMIGCGNSLITLAASTIEEAIDEAKQMLVEDYGCYVGSEREVSELKIVQIMADIDPNELTREEEDEEDEETAAERAQYEVLKRKFG